jgi:hypothetical protein
VVTISAGEDTQEAQ